MHNTQELSKEKALPNELSKETINYIHDRLELSQPIKLPKEALHDMLDNISNPETLKTLLGEQIITTHNIIMTLGIRAGLEAKNGILQRLPAIHALTKLINAFTRQIETLERLNAPDTQNININKLEVSENGQAFVGNYSKS